MSLRDGGEIGGNQTEVQVVVLGIEEEGEG